MSIGSQIDRINQNIANTYSVLESAGATMPAETNSDNLAATAQTISAVLYGKAQGLTDEQKAQARSNIGVSEGNDGFSPTISVTEIDGGQRLTITDINGVKTVDIMDGIDGKDGKDGTTTEEDGGNETTTTTETVKYAPSAGTGDVLCDFQSGFIDTSGVYQESSTFECTQSIPIDPENTTISINIITYTTVSAVAFYDASGAFISCIKSPEGNYNWQTCDVGIPSNARSVRFTFLYNVSNDSQYAVVTKTTTTVAGATTTTTRYTNSGDTSGDVEATVFGFIDTNGVYQESGGYHCIQYIPIDPLNTKISVNLRGYTSFYNVVYYTSAKVLISGVSVNTNGGYVTGDMEIPDNAAYVGFTFTDSGSSQYADVSITVYEEDDSTSGGTDVNVAALEQRISEAEEKVSEMYSETMERDFTAIIANQADGAFLRAVDGGTDGSNTGSVSDYISINTACLIDYCLYGNATYAPIVFYDEHRDYISALTPTSAGFHTDSGIVPPENAYYLRYAAINSSSGYADQFIRITRNTVKSLGVEVERQKANTPLYGKILTATGDSITATVSNRPYASYARMIAADNGMTYESKAIWGATIASGVSSSGCILDTLSSMRSDADYVILSGGANDFYALAGGTEVLGTISSGYYASLDTTTFCGAVESLCKAAIDKWHGKKILFVITHRMLDISAQDALQTHVATLIQILEKWGIPYVDLWHDMPSLAYGDLKNLYTSNGNTVYAGVGDGVHPNEDGYRLYYVPRVEAKLKAI